MIDLDHNATTRPLPQAVEAAREAMTASYANPSSVHRGGQDARRAVELARVSMAALIGAAPKALTFCSCGTESIDLAIRSALATAPGGRSVIVTTAVEHAAVRELVDHVAKREGAEVRLAPLDAEGIVDVGRLAPLLDARVRLVSVQWCNNETGAIQPIDQVSALAKARSGAACLVHTDAVQRVGKLPIDLRDPALGAIDLLSLSAHKFHGPKGVGALWVRPGIPLWARLLGTQELGRRAGTENVPGIAGAGAAGEATAQWLADEPARTHLGALRDRFEAAVLDGATRAGVRALVNGPRDSARRLWNTTNIGFEGLQAEAILLMLSERGVWASAGAACSSGSLDPSPVLLAMGVPEPVAHGSVRFSIGRFTTGQELDEAARIVVECVARLR